MFFIILEIGLRMAGWIIVTRQEHRNKISLKQGDSYVIMCLGESTTANLGPGNYPEQLEEILNQYATGTTFKILNKGVAGITTDRILARLEYGLEKYKPNMVITMMGVNDEQSSDHYDLNRSNIISQTKLALLRFKVYKLGRLLWLHFLKKCEFNIDTTQKNKQNDIRAVDTKTYYELLKLYEDEEMIANKIDILEQMIKIDPFNVHAYKLLSNIYLWGRYKNMGEVERINKIILELYPQDKGAYLQLAYSYESRLKTQAAKDILADGISKIPLYKQGYGALAHIYTDNKEYDNASKYFNKANSIEKKYRNENLYYNYNRLKHIVLEKGIALVCVQYPVRSVESLKRMLGYDERVIFVDNEKIFKKALQENSYDAIFVDMWAGDFGHCTRKGYRMLAQNVADVILKEAFK
ncbi:MAG: hypothetical protein ABIH47_00455 [Candidatus Omnitrophota bacterium]